MYCILDILANKRIKANGKGGNLLLHFNRSNLELSGGYFLNFGDYIHNHEFVWIHLRLQHLHYWRSWSVLLVAKDILFHENVLTNFCFCTNDIGNAERYQNFPFHILRWSVCFLEQLLCI